MLNEKVKELAESLIGISPLDWAKLKMTVDYCFEKKKKELERELKLDSSEEIKDSIQSQLGSSFKQTHFSTKQA